MQRKDYRLIQFGFWCSSEDWYETILMKYKNAIKRNDIIDAEVIKQAAYGGH